MSTAIRSLTIEGFRCFASTSFSFGPLSVLVGPNGTGKTALFEFLRFLREAMIAELPAEIVPGCIGRQIFHRPGEDRIRWSLEVHEIDLSSVLYAGEILGPVGRSTVDSETARTLEPLGPSDAPLTLMDIRGGRGQILDWDGNSLQTWDIALRRPNQLVLGTVRQAAFSHLCALREALSSWRFYSSFRFDFERIRRPVAIEQTPQLHEDCGNLSSLLLYLMTEHPERYQELCLHVQLCVPGMESLRVKARGGPGEVMAYWKEKGVNEELSLADLSDGTLRMLCWAALCLHPQPPSLICIDEPEQGLHPRVLPTLQGLLDRASEQTQLMVATHSSYFLSLFRLEDILVMTRAPRGVRASRAADSRTLKGLLDEEFECDTLERMHRTNELEVLL